MARTCGIRIGRTDFDLLILEGSVKKPSVAACVTGEIPADSEDPVADLTAALKAAIKGLKVPTDAIRVVGESGVAAYRNLVLPFDDPSKIEQVIKFEVESKVPQWDIDDAVVDFHVAASTGVESHLLTTIAPKSAVGEWIEAATKAGLEPQECELDTTALVNCAARVDVLSAEGSQVLIHVAQHSTALVVVDGGRVRDMRSLQIGAVHAEEEGARKRFMRELRRTAVAMQTTHALDGVYVSGFPFPGVVDAEVADLRVRQLEPFEADGLPAGKLPSRFTAAFGAALAEQGSVKIKSSLRREELRFAGKLERLELPLAVFALLLAALAGIQYVVLQRAKAPLETDMTRWFESSNLYMLGEPKKGTTGYIERPEELFTKRVDAIRAQVDQGELSEYQGLQRILAYINEDIKAIEKRVGKDTEIRKPQSVLGAMVRVVDVLADLDHDQLEYFSILSMMGDFRPARGNEDDFVELKFSMSFFSELNTVKATENFDLFKETVEAEPWCIEFDAPKTQSLDGGAGIYIENFTVKVDMTVGEEVPGV